LQILIPQKRFLATSAFPSLIRRLCAVFSSARCYRILLRSSEVFFRAGFPLIPLCLLDDLLFCL